MQKNNFYGIIKFGQAKHVNELYENGIVYMQRVENYTQINHEEIGDKNENITQLWQSKQIKSFTINGEKVEIINNLKIKESNRKNPFVFSSYALTENQFKNGKNIISRNVLDFGDTALLITDFNKFFNLIQNNINETDNLYCNLVEYIDEHKYHGNMTVLKKLKQYKHQREHRIVLESSNYMNNSIKITIGSLKDIAHIFPTKTLLETLKIE